MGQKLHPFIFRVILNRNWSSIWYTSKNNFSIYLKEDLIIKNFIYKTLNKVLISKIIIQKSLLVIYITIFVKDKLSLSNINNLKNFNLNDVVSNYIGKNVVINIKEVLNPFIDPVLIFYVIKEKIENKKSYKTIINDIMLKAFKCGALGIKIILQGRILGSVMSRRHIFKQGKMSLHKIISDIRYYNGIVLTNYGIIGIKIWIYLGDLIY